MVTSIFWQPREAANGDGQADPPFITDAEVHLRVLTNQEAQEWLEWETKKVDQNVREMRAREKAKTILREEREASLISEDGQADAATKFGATILTRQGLRSVPDPEPLIDGFLTLDSLVRTWGAPKTYKSFVTLDMAACISLGIPWQGHRTHKQKVLYIVAEGARGMQHRVDAWEEQNDCELDVLFYPEALQISDEEKMRGLIAYCKRESIRYVVFDTQARCTVGVDENSNTEMGQIIHSLDVLKRETGACVHLVHHSGTAGDGRTASRGRGATAFDGAVDAEFYTERKEDSSVVSFKTRFQKDIAEADVLYLDLIQVAYSLAVSVAEEQSAIGVGVHVPTLTDSQAVALHELENRRVLGVTVPEWADDSGRSKSDLRNLVEVLAPKELIVQDGTRWFISALGDAALKLHSKGRKSGDAPPHVQDLMSG